MDKDMNEKIIDEAVKKFKNGCRNNTSSAIGILAKKKLKM